VLFDGNRNPTSAATLCLARLQRLEPFDFLRGQVPILTGAEMRITQKPNLNPFQLYDRVPHMFEHLANLIVLALDKSDAQPGIFRFLQDLDPARSQSPTIQVNSFFQLLQLANGRHSPDFGQVRFWAMISG